MRIWLDQHFGSMGYYVHVRFGDHGHVTVRVDADNDNQVFTTANLFGAWATACRLAADAIASGQPLSGSIISTNVTHNIMKGSYSYDLRHLDY